MIVRQFCLFFFKQLKIRKWQAEYNSASSYILRSSAKATQTLAITWARITFKMSSSLKLVPASVMEICKYLANNIFSKMLVIDKNDFFFKMKETISFPGATRTCLTYRSLRPSLIRQTTLQVPQLLVQVGAWQGDLGASASAYAYCQDLIWW